ncbi:MAG: hypothetical protein KatS3mg045_1483 [Bellilinea sp.]|nr:MAG: hypothetical protein KatS3mg045_1483 [Bellilinea sp.]
MIKKFSITKRLLIFLVIFFIQFLFKFWHSSNAFAQIQSVNTNLYLPIILNNFSFAGDKFIGIYMPAYWGTNQIVKDNLDKANRLASKPHSVVGWFISIQDKAFLRSNLSYWEIRGNNFYAQLESLWTEGYISFINIGSGKEEPYTSDINCPYKANLESIASGECDKAIRVMAQIYSQWTRLGEGRKAFVALFPEMNDTTNKDNYTTGDIYNYKLAFQRIKQIFREEQVDGYVWWVFAPNGWSWPDHKFENYYPGDDLVDVIAFSSYNFGYCWVMGEWKEWADYNTVFGQYITRLQKMAPNKRIIIAQTGVVPDRNFTGENNYEEKNVWIRDTYTKLSQEPSVLGVLYFDIDGNCRWGITSQPFTYTGYAQGAANFKKLNSSDLTKIIKK